MSIIILFLCIIFITTNNNAKALTSESDIQALKAFKSAIDPSSIPSWSCLATWDFTAADPCSLPRRTHFTCALTCSPNSTRVTQITLDPVGYSGPLHQLVSKLTELAVLDIADNSFHGQIPPSISSLSNLRALTLRSNSFSGPIPPAVTKLASLETLDFSRNSLAGAIPSSMSSMIALRRLDLSFNKLAGSLPEKLPASLIDLAVKGNSLSGPVSEESFAGLTQLVVVELSENSLSGTLGSWFFLLPSIQQVNLANNSLTRVEVSSPSSGIGSDLVAVDLGFNKIDGYAPAEFAGYPILSSLSLRYNRLRGKIPVEYGQKQSLRRLYLDGNYFNGQPPAVFFAGKSGVSGSLGDNCLWGCPRSSQLCLPSQKSSAVCKEAYSGGRGKKPKS